MIAATHALRAARVSAHARSLSVITTSSEQFDYLREILNSRVYDAAIETPLSPATSLSAKVGCDVFIKREDCQPVFSFKIRGAYNKIVSLNAEQRRRGVVACSAGNHAPQAARQKLPRRASSGGFHISCSEALLWPPSERSSHRQGVARSCALLGIPAVVVMPRATPRIKVDAVARHGGTRCRIS